MLPSTAPACLLAFLTFQFLLLPVAAIRPGVLLELIQRQVAASNGTSNVTGGANSSSSSNGVSNQSGVVPLQLASDKQTYFTTLTVGNITFRAALDTGSADFWLLSTGCTDSVSACKDLPRYPLLYDSPSFIAVNDNNTVFNVSFADTTHASGFVARETIQLASLSTQQALGLANSSNVSFVDDISGILGLGFPRLSTIDALATNATPFFTTLAQQGSLVYPVFGVGLTRSAPWGTLTLGAVDSTFVKNASLIGWNEVVPFEPFGSESNRSSYFQWAIPMSNIVIGTQSIQPLPTYSQANGNKSLALIDVGTEGIFGPYQDVERIFSALDTSRLVDETGQWAIPCDTTDTMTFTFDDQNYTLLPSDYLIGPVSTDTALCLAWPKASAPSGDGIDWQLGGAFLRTVYSIFSYGIAEKEPPMIGLYPLHSSNTTALPQASLSALFSSLSLTVATALPNTLLLTPTPTTPPYLFNTTVPTGNPDQADLATSTYVPLLRGGASAATGLPELVPGQVTITKSGVVITSTVPPLTQTPALGVYPGQPSSAATACWRPGVVVLTLAFVTCALRLL